MFYPGSVRYISLWGIEFLNLFFLSPYVRLVISGLICAWAVGVSASPLKVAKKQGTISGKLSVDTAKLATKSYATLYNFSDTDVTVRQKPFNKMFSFSNVNGVSVLVLRSRALSKKLKQSIFHVTHVQSKMRAMEKLTNQLRISAGGITVQNPNGTKRNGYADSSFIFDLVNASNRCGSVVVDPEFDPAYSGIKNELALNSSSYVDSRYRTDFQTALKTLNQWTPKYRLTGNVSLLGGPQSGGAELALVDVESGSVVWRKSYFGSMPISQISRDAGNAVWQQLCSAHIPLSLQGDFTGISEDGGGGSKINWNGTFSFKIQEGYENLTWSEIQVLPALPYVISGLSATWKQSGGSPCRIEAEGTYTFHESELINAAPLRIKPAADESTPAKFELLLGKSFPLSVPQHFFCSSPEPIESTTVPTIQIFSGETSEFLPFGQDGDLSGAFQSGIYSYGWTLKVIDWFDPTGE